jgi:hypothetical protein
MEQWSNENENTLKENLSEKWTNNGNEKNEALLSANQQGHEIVRGKLCPLTPSVLLKSIKSSAVSVPHSLPLYLLQNILFFFSFLFFPPPFFPFLLFSACEFEVSLSL